MIRQFITAGQLRFCCHGIVAPVALPGDRNGLRAAGHREPGLCLRGRHRQLLGAHGVGKVVFDRSVGRILKVVLIVDGLSVQARHFEIVKIRIHLIGPQSRRALQLGSRNLAVLHIQNQHAVYIAFEMLSLTFQTERIPGICFHADIFRHFHGVDRRPILI